jgi:hypothetical protein
MMGKKSLKRVFAETYGHSRFKVSWTVALVEQEACGCVGWSPRPETRCPHMRHAPPSFFPSLAALPAPRLEGPKWAKGPAPRLLGRGGSGQSPHAMRHARTTTKPDGSGRLAARLGTS